MYFAAKSQDLKNQLKNLKVTFNQSNKIKVMEFFLIKILSYFQKTKKYVSYSCVTTAYTVQKPKKKNSGFYYSIAQKMKLLVGSTCLIVDRTSKLTMKVAAMWKSGLPLSR